jgi:parallel beta-helix repeat protein
MNKAGWVIAGVLALLVIAAMARVSWGGPLDPPVAVTTPTGSNLIFQPANCGMFPINISAEGSYKLAQNITIPPACAQNGIEINASNVTLDLGGFVLRGSGGSLRGVSIPGAGTRGTSISNGKVTGWGQDGINSNGNDSLLQDLVLHSNAGAGVNLGSAKYFATLENVVATNNSGDGIILGPAATLSHCTSSGNGGAGVRLSGSHSIVQDCTVVFNLSGGVVMSGATVGHLIENNTANGNTGIGISVGASGAAVRGNTVNGNTTNGIDVSGSGNTIEDNLIRSSVAYAIMTTGGRNRVIGNHASDNHTAIGCADIWIAGGGVGNIVENNSAESAGIGPACGLIYFDAPSIIAHGNIVRDTSGAGSGYTTTGACVACDIGPIGTAAVAASPWANIAN